jgi:signal transduction histidine kinase/CheY-like chemotaxis protein
MDLVTRLSRLGVPAERRAALTALADACGARACYLFVPHPDDPQRLLPAPGYVESLPGSRGWRELLARCMTPGTHTGQVAYPTAHEVAPAVAYAHAGVTLVLVGLEAAYAPLSEAFDRIAVLLAAMLRAERDAAIARGELELAKQAAVRAETLARALDIARGEAEQATRAKDEFLAMLGHELRNPLAPIVMALQVLRLENVPPRIQDVLERQVDHLQRLVDDLLDVSRITRGKIELRREQLELATSVTRALEMARPLLQQKRNELVVEVPPKGLCVDGDPARLAQVISNLVTNASKYSDPGTRIRIHGERAGMKVRLTVEDQGIGIEPQMLDRVFERFMQAPQGLDRAAGGLGLGLAIVRSLVQLHGGTVNAFSEGLGRGSTFVVELPFHAGPVKSESTGTQPAVRPRSARILVVDDNRDAAELMSEVLTSFDYCVRIAHDGPAALAIVDEFMPQVAMLDIGLPGMDGYDLARELRTRAPAAKLVAVTGYGQASDRERAQAAGFSAHLTKPVTIARVQETLARLLD